MYSMTEPTKQPIGFGLPSTTPSTAYTETKPVLFKYQQAEPETKAHHPIGFTFPAVAKSTLPKPSLGTQEEQLPLPDFGGFKARRDVFASPALSDSETLSQPSAEGQKSVSEPECLKTLSQPSAEGHNGLYSDWLKAVQRHECKPSVRETWSWIQKRIAPTETGTQTDDRTRISHMQKAFFNRAIKEGLMVLNPHYKNGGKKYLWLA
jgi:hypothetical protein